MRCLVCLVCLVPSVASASWQSQADASKQKAENAADAASCIRWDASGWYVAIEGLLDEWVQAGATAGDAAAAMAQATGIMEGYGGDVKNGDNKMSDGDVLFGLGNTQYEKGVDTSGNNWFYGAKNRYTDAEAKYNSAYGYYQSAVDDLRLIHDSIYLDLQRLNKEE